MPSKEYRSSAAKSSPSTSTRAHRASPPTVMLSTVTVTSPTVRLSPTVWVRLSMRRAWLSLISPPVPSAHLRANQSRRLGLAAARAVPAASTTTSAAAISPPMGRRRLAFLFCSRICNTSCLSVSEARTSSNMSRYLFFMAHSSVKMVFSCSRPRASRVCTVDGFIPSRAAMSFTG